MEQQNVKCDGFNSCQSHDITHLDHKGFVYCAKCALIRKDHMRRVRKLRLWELKLIRSGQPVPSYRPISKREGLSRMAGRAAK